MRSSTISLQRWLPWALLCLFICTLSGPVLAQETASNIRVLVADLNGDPAEGVAQPPPEV